jgi:hypothetical protein
VTVGAVQQSSGDHAPAKNTKGRSALAADLLILNWSGRGDLQQGDPAQQSRTISVALLDVMVRIAPQLRGAKQRREKRRV